MVLQPAAIAYTSWPICFLLPWDQLFTNFCIWTLSFGTTTCYSHENYVEYLWNQTKLVFPNKLYSGELSLLFTFINVTVNGKTWKWKSNKVTSLVSHHLSLRHRRQVAGIVPDSHWGHSVVFYAQQRYWQSFLQLVSFSKPGYSHIAKAGLEYQSERLVLKSRRWPTRRPVSTRRGFRNFILTWPVISISGDCLCVMLTTPPHRPG